MGPTTGENSDPIWADLVMAMLAVGAYPVERVARLQDRLAVRGLLDPTNLAKWSVAEVASELQQAGYDRGRLTGMYADRLVSLGKLLAERSQERATLEDVLTRGDEGAVREITSGWHGIGPKVVANLLALRATRTTSGHTGSVGSE